MKGLLQNRQAQKRSGRQEECQSDHFWALFSTELGVNVQKNQALAVISASNVEMILFSGVTQSFFQTHGSEAVRVPASSTAFSNQMP